MLPPDGLPRFPHITAGQRADGTTEEWSWVEWLLLPLVLGFVWLIWIGIAVGVPLAFQAITSHFAKIAFQGALIVVVVGVATAFYVLRCRKLRFYAVCEFAVGLWGALFAVNTIYPTVHSLAHDPGPAFATVAALYIIVRAFDNYCKSIKEDFSRREWNRFFFGVDSKERLA